MADEYMKARLLTLPKEIKEQELKIIEANKTRQDYENQRKKIEQKMYLIVSSETEVTTDAKGVEKITKKYTNEAQREAEVQDRLGLNNDYIQLLQQVGIEEQNARLATIERDYLLNELKSIGLVVKLLEIER